MIKVLTIDDSAFGRLLNAKALEGSKFELVEAANGLEGLSAVQEHGPDCIILDMLMPLMDGVEFLRKLRETNSELPVIVVSADIQESRRAECEALGISAFLNKPVPAEDIVAAVEQAVCVLKGEAG